MCNETFKKISNFTQKNRTESLFNKVAACYDGTPPQTFLLRISKILRGILDGKVIAKDKNTFSVSIKVIIIMVFQMEQNYSESNYIFKKKICMIFTKTFFLSKNLFIFQIKLFI